MVEVVDLVIIVEVVVVVGVAIKDRAVVVAEVNRADNFVRHDRMYE